MRCLLASALLSTAMGVFSHAAEVTYQLLTAPSMTSTWPGADELIGTSDDVVDAAHITTGGSGSNTVGGFSHVSFDFNGPGGDPNLAGDFDAISFFSAGSFTFDAAAGGGSPLITSFDITSGTEPFFGHGPYSATTNGTVAGSSTGTTFAVTSAPYDTIIRGNPDSATMSFSGTYKRVDPSGAPTGDQYYDEVLTPVALANGATSYVVLSGTGFSGPAADFSFPNMPIQVSLVGFERADTPSTAPTLLGLTFDLADGTAQASIRGEAGARYQLAEAADLDFAHPDRNPVPLTEASVGTLDGNVVITDAGGNATVQFSLDPSRSANFLRAEAAP